MCSRLSILSYLIACNALVKSYARCASDMAQMRLAAEFGFSTNTYIGLIEHGKKQPSLTFVIRIADLFDVSIDQLLRDHIELPPPEFTRWMGTPDNEP